jgi:predicted amidohydrolase
VRAVTLKVACVQLQARPLVEARAAFDDILTGVTAAAAFGAHIAVLPECSYPAYVLLAKKPFRGLPDSEAVLQRVARHARAAGVSVALGIARYDDRGRLRNEAVFIDRAGREVARYAKIFLWNFDRRWFTAGREVRAFDSEFGRLGMLICADGRMPEIARTMALRGAWLLLDPTAWVAFGPSYDRMHNPQVEFMMSARAKENGVWIAAADKVGSENGAVQHVGKSMIVAPDGSVRAIGPAASPAVIVAEIQRDHAAPFVVPLSSGERRDLARQRPSGTGGTRTHTIGLLQGPFGPGRARAIAALAAQGAQAIFETPSAPAVLAAAAKRLRGVSVEAIDGKRMLAPEPARAAALRGVDLLLWARPPKDPLVLEFARTRAMENRVYVAVCATVRDAQAACVVDPQGTVIVQALEREASGVVAAIDTAKSRDKTVVDGTDAFAARVPSAFDLPPRKVRP